KRGKYSSKVARKSLLGGRAGSGERAIAFDLIENRDTSLTDSFRPSGRGAARTSERPGRSKDAPGRGREGKRSYRRTTLRAWGPFGPSTTSKETRSPSPRVRNPSAWIAVW